MSGRIKGITIEFDGNTTKLQKALKDVEAKTRSMKTGLRDVDKLLKFNPTSTVLLTQKQQMFRTALDQSRQKLQTLKEAYAQMERQPGFDKNSEDAQRLQREIIATEQEIKRFQKQVERTASVTGMKMEAIGSKISGIGTKISAVGSTLTTKLTVPIAAAAAVGIKKFAEVDKTMQLTKSTMNATAAEAKQLNQAMKDAASNSTFGMSEAATASLNFARAGLTATQAADTLAPAMNLAAGEGGTLDTVSSGLVATINGFKGSFSEASEYADVFANACNNSALDVDSLSNAMSVAAPVFASAGYSVSDAALYMGVMANNGIDANKAANSLKTGISRLVKPTDEAASWMSELGISITDSKGQMKDTVTVQKELHNAFKDLSNSEKIAAASAIFGKNQMAPWLALINAAPEDVQKLSKSLEETGTTTEMAEAMMSGFGGSLEKIKSSIDVAATSFGESLAPYISQAADKVQDLVDKFNALSDEEKGQVTKIALIAAAAGPLLVVTGKITSGIGSIVSAGGKLMSTITAIMSGTAAATTVAGAAVVAVAALAGAAYALTKEHERGLEAAYGFSDAQQKTIDTLDEAVETYENVKAARDESLSDVQTEYTLIENLKDEYNGLVDSNGNVKEGYEARAEYIKGELAEALGLEESQIDELIDKNGKLVGAIDEVIAAKKAEAIVEANQDTYKQALKQQNEAAEQLAPAIDTLNAKKAEQAAAEEKLAAAQKAYDAASQNGARNHTEAANRLNNAKEAYTETSKEVKKAEESIKEYNNTISDAKKEIDAYEGLTKAIADKDTKAMEQWTKTYTEGIKTRKNATKDELTEQADTINEQYKAIKQAYKDGELGITKDTVKQAKKRRDAADQEAGVVRKAANKKKKAAKESADSVTASSKRESAAVTSNSKKAASAASTNSASAKKSTTKNYSAAASSAKADWKSMASTAETQMSNVSSSLTSAAETATSTFPVELGQLFHGTLVKIKTAVTDAGNGAKNIDQKLERVRFAKGYTKPLLFNSPTLIPALVGDRGDSYGGEMLYGRANLMRDIKEAIGGTGQQVFNITVDGAESPEAYASRLMRQLRLESRMQ